MSRGGRPSGVPGAGIGPGVRHDLQHVLSTLQAMLTVADGARPTPPEDVLRLVAAARREAGVALAVLDVPPGQEPAPAGPGVPLAVPTDGPCDVDGVVRAAADAQTRTGRPVAVRSPGRLLVPLDATSLARVVRNLLTNAVAATAPQGTVELRVCRVAPEEAPDGVSLVRIEVHDDGPGVPASGPRRNGGQGLSVVRSLVLPAGGWLVVGRSPLGGACVAVTLPEVTAQGPR